MIHRAVTWTAISDSNCPNDDMPETRQAKPLPIPDSDTLRFLPEGPIPVGDSRFSWIAIQHGLTATTGSLNIYDITADNNKSFDLPGRPGFAIPCESNGKFVIGCERSLGIFDTSDLSWKPFREGIDDDVENTIINDGLAYEDNLVFGTKDLEFATKKAGLYLYRGGDDQLIRLRDDQICSNGKAIVANGSHLTLIDIDSPTRQIVRYQIDIAAGKLSEAEVGIDFTGDPAVPDGAILTPDESGIIVSMFRPEVADHGETRLYNLTTGQLQCVWQTPGSPQNTCPALVRHDGSIKLVITTAVEHMSEADQEKCPNAGRLFIGDTDFVDDGKPLALPYQG
jgi:sugar lactone lactonase YvrE